MPVVNSAQALQSSGVDDLSNLNLLPEPNSKNATFGRQAQLSQKFHKQNTLGLNSCAMTADSVTNQPAVCTLNHTAMGESDFQNTSHFQTLGQ